MRLSKLGVKKPYGFHLGLLKHSTRGIQRLYSESNFSNTIMLWETQATWIGPEDKLPFRQEAKQHVAASHIVE